MPDWNAGVPPATLRSSVKRQQIGDSPTMPIDYNFLPKGLKSREGWYKRGHLPHFDGGTRSQFLTFRLFDSVPQSLIEEWKSRLTDVQFRKRVEKFLDSGYGACFLKNPSVAAMIAESFQFHNGKMYDLTAWVIMPNHTHMSVDPYAGVDLSRIVHSVKSYTAHEANKILGRTGRFWQVEPFDRYIRNARHYASVIKYIENNPVKAGLCGRPSEWRYSSAYVAG
jgi:putative DNA methylase